MPASSEHLTEAYIAFEGDMREAIRHILMTKAFELQRLTVDSHAERRIVADELTGDFMAALNRIRKPLDSTF